jgi:hypothetical protein
MWLVASEMKSEDVGDRCNGGLTPVQQRDFARFLVGYRQYVLQASIAIAQLVATTLLGLDALLANLFAATLNHPVIKEMTNQRSLEGN